MKRLQLNQLIKSSVSYAAVSAATVDAWLLLADRTGALDVSPDWYVNAPLLAWGVVGIPASIALGERLLATALEKPGRIHAISALAAAEDSSAGGLRAIPWTRRGVKSVLLASTSRWQIGEQAAPSATGGAPPASVCAWRVPVAGDYITIGERELIRFLELASKRTKYQFSRRYWTERRRPPMPMIKYLATMDLLTSAGLIEARGVGSSGWLVGGIKPHNAVTFLKFESKYRL